MSEDGRLVSLDMTKEILSHILTLKEDKIINMRMECRFLPEHYTRLRRVCRLWKDISDQTFFKLVSGETFLR